MIMWKVFVGSSNLTRWGVCVLIPVPISGVADPIFQGHRLRAGDLGAVVRFAGAARDYATGQG